MGDQKRYLTGLDWIIHALDSATRRFCSTGNSSQIVLELDGKLDASAFTEALHRFASAFPVLWGEVARGWTLEPYWRIPSAPKNPTIRIEVAQVEAADLFSALERFINQPFSHSREYVAFQLFHRSDHTSCLAMKFDHRLLDARGAEEFLSLFGQYFSGEIELEQLAKTTKPVQPSLLNRWRERFLAGRSMMRAMRGFADCTAQRLVHDDACKGESSFLHLPLNSAESNTFFERANQEAGFLMFMPYALSRAVEAFDELCLDRGQRGTYIVPCTTDLRGMGAAPDKLFFNYCSMFFFRVDPEQMENRAQLLLTIKEQFYAQSKAGFPRHFESVMALMRILPVRLFDWMIRRHMRHCFGSFSFASVGAGFFEEGRFCGLEVNNVFHMPQVPPQVGIGFFFNQYRGRINIGVSFREGLVDDAGRRKILSTLQEMG